MKNKDKKKKNRTYIGGQAVIEGVMMSGKKSMACAVRDPDGVIQIESKRVENGKHLSRALKIPFVRGVVSLVLSTIRGIKTLMRSAAVYGEDEEDDSRLQKWLAEKMKVNLMDVISIISTIVGVALAIGIFILLPRFLISLIPPVQNTPWEYVLLCVFKLIIFFLYLFLIKFLKDIKRLYMYHGAEHKTINAFEHGVELTPEKVKECSRIHDRCGTSFLFIVVIINVVLISVATWAFATYVYNVENRGLRFLLNVGIELVLLPVIAGISYEILRLLAKFDNKFVDIFKAPGKALQKFLTTCEPTDDMLEVAIAAFKKVQEMDEDPTVDETEFVTSGILSKMLERTKAKFKEKDIDESDAEWIYSLVLGIKRSELNVERMIVPSESKRIREIELKRLEGRPLWYIIGDTEFYGCKIKVDERALIPRPETEMLAEVAVRTVEDGNKILDMCTGSGCIAIAIAKHCVDKSVSVTGADLSDAAIMLAKENAKLNHVNVDFVQSDMFSSVHGRFNLIVCNPPYVKTADIPNLQKEVREYEPRIALDGGEDGLDFYRRLSEMVRNYLAKDGVLLLECGEGQTDEILKLFGKRDYAMVIKDLSGVDRFLKIAF